MKLLISIHILMEMIHIANGAAFITRFAVIWLYSRSGDRRRSEFYPLRSEIISGMKMNVASCGKI